MYLSNWPNVFVPITKCICSAAAASGQVLSVLCIKIIHPWTFCGDTFRIWEDKISSPGQILHYREQKSCIIESRNPSLLKIESYRNCGIQLWKRRKTSIWNIIFRNSTNIRNLRHALSWKSKLIWLACQRRSGFCEKRVTLWGEWAGGVSGKWVKDSWAGGVGWPSGMSSYNHPLAKPPRQPNLQDPCTRWKPSLRKVFLLKRVNPNSCKCHPVAFHLQCPRMGFKKGGWPIGMSC